MNEWNQNEWMKLIPQSDSNRANEHTIPDEGINQSLRFSWELQGWVTDRLHDWVTDWVNVCREEWLAGWLDDWMAGRVDYRKSVWMSD